MSSVPGRSSESVLLRDDPQRRVSAYVQTLASMPTDIPWTLVGGLAVNIRVARIHRTTNDMDTISGHSIELLELLVAEFAEPLSHATVRFRGSGVEVDVMDSTEGLPLPEVPEERAFALARRWAAATPTMIEIRVVGEQGRLTGVRCRIPVASHAALVALKSIAIPRRPHGHHPEKVGSDIHDLFRVIQARGFDRTAEDFASADPELRSWVGEFLERQFRGDLRYAILRLRRLALSEDARSITEDDLALLGDLGAAIRLAETTRSVK